MIFRRILMQSIGRIAISFLAAFVVFACSSKKEDSQRSSNAQTVVRIIDGDTFVLSDGSKIRITAVDTPEKGEKLYDEACRMLDSLILNKQVTIRPLATGTDRYGRILAEVFIDTVNVGARILRSGLGYLYIFNDNVALRNKYLDYQIKAMDDRLGIWSISPPVPEEYYYQIRGSYRFHRPLCSSLKKVAARRLIKIADRNAALRRGLAPCRNCRP